MRQVFTQFFTHRANIVFTIFALGLYVASFLLDSGHFLSHLWILTIPIVLAPFVEWILHKLILHRIVDPVKDPASYDYMLKLHYKHHWEPANIPWIFAPFSGPIILFVVFFPFGYLLFRDTAMTLLFGAGVVSYFLFYEWIHLAHHMPSYRPMTAFGRHLKNAHTWHHYKNENFWWGVTNPLGDYLLGTFKDPKEVEFSPGAKNLGNMKKSYKS